MTTGRTIWRSAATKEPLVDQGLVYGWRVSWNPDDGRFYVHEGEHTKATFTRFANLVQFCRKHAKGDSHDRSKAQA